MRVSTSIYSRIGFSFLIVFSLVLLSAVAFIDDTEPVTITSVSVSPDSFVCSLPSQADNPNNGFTISVKAQDNVGVAVVQADLSALDLGTQDLSYNPDGDVWEGTFTLSDTSTFDFTAVEIPISADDDTGNGFQPAEGINPAAELILYSMAAPPPLSECQQVGSGTTNLCNEVDFTDIHFIYEVEQFGSPECNGGREMPWGSQFEKIVRWEFESVNFDDPNIEEKLLAVAGALDVFITPPGEFGDSSVNVDTSAFAELDTATTITLYGLPFADFPTILEPEGREETVSLDDFWVDDPWEIEVYDEETGDYLFTQYVPYSTLTFTVEGFSRYDISDDALPLVEITSPNHAVFFTSSTLEGEVYVDGTGSQVHDIQVLLDEQEALSLTYEDIMASCSANDDSFTQVYCNFQLNDVAEGDHTLTIIATDLGGDYGNAAGQEITVTRDITGPDVKYFFITPEQATPEETIVVTAKAVDDGSGLQSITLQDQEEQEVSGIQAAYEPDFISEGIYSYPISLADFALGTHTLLLTATDNVGNTYTETRTFNVTENSSSGFAYLENGAAFDDEEKEIIAVPELNVSFQILVTDDVTTSFLVEDPLVVLGADATGLHLDNFVKVTAPELEGNIASAKITLNYSDAEVAAKGIEESSLRLYFYNETSGSWVKYDGDDGLVPDGGVDTAANEVWALTDHFSTWGMFGAAPAPPTPAPTPKGGGGGGGGSSGGIIVKKVVVEPQPELQPGNRPPIIESIEQVPPATETIESEDIGAVSPAASGSSPVGVGQATGLFSRFTSGTLWGGVAALGVLALLGGLGFSRWKKHL